jgi:hypothetical protein
MKTSCDISAHVIQPTLPKTTATDTIYSGLPTTYTAQYHDFLTCLKKKKETPSNHTPLHHYFGFHVQVDEQLDQQYNVISQHWA